MTRVTWSWKDRAFPFAQSEENMNNKTRAKNALTRRQDRGAKQAHQQETSSQVMHKVKVVKRCKPRQCQIII